MLKQKYFLADVFILSAEKQPIKSSWRKIVWLPITVAKNATVLLKSSIPFDKTNWRIKIPKTRMTPNTKE